MKVIVPFKRFWSSRQPLPPLVAVLVVYTVALYSHMGCRLEAHAESGRPPEARGPEVWSERPEEIPISIKEMAHGLTHPWGMAWLPDGDALITERPGTVRRWSAKSNALSSALPGLPPVFASGQGGLLDIAIDPEFEKSRFVFLSLSSGSAGANRTEVIRAHFDGQALSHVRTIFRVAHDKQGTQHFGSRLLFLPDHSLLISVGDGGNPPASFEGDLIRNQAQRLSSHFGKVVRLLPDGAPPTDNPWISDRAAQSGLWTIGHRNIQGLAYDHLRKEVLASEHGPRGGDEINVLRAGANYGWPAVTYGVEYSGSTIAVPHHVPPYTPPLLAWAPSIAPSGLVVYRGARFPDWQGNLFSGGLVSADVRMIKRDLNGAAVRQYSLPIGARVRDVRQGPDGYLYALTDEPRGRLLRISPKLQ